MNVPRGIRNFNPGNVKHFPGNRWIGLAPESEWGDEKTFCVFTAPWWGIRVTAYLLRKHYEKRGCDTVRKLIAQYAPKEENDVDAYAGYVAKALGVEPDERLEYLGFRALQKMLPAIVQFENGIQPYSWEIEAGILLAQVEPREIVYYPRDEEMGYAD